MQKMENTITAAVQFIWRLYGYNFKQRQPFISKVKGQLTRAISRDDITPLVSKANQVYQTVSASTPLPGFIPLNDNEMNGLKKVLKEFALDVKNIIDKPKNLCSLADRAFQFGKDWNNLVRELKGSFLKGFGYVHQSQLNILSEDTVVPFLKKLREATDTPEDISILHKKRNNAAIITSINYFNAKQKL